jgi:hypothetical protein
MSLRSWILDKLHPFVEGVTVTRFQYYVCVFFVLAFNLSVICLSLYLLGVLASNRMSVLGLVLIISESTLAMVLRIYQVSAVLGHPAHRRVENSGWLCYGYVLIPPLCIVGTSMLMLSLASHCSAVETACTDWIRSRSCCCRIDVPGRRVVYAAKFRSGVRLSVPSSLVRDELGGHAGTTG